MHIIAAKAVCLKEAADPGFREYAKQIVANARKLAAEISKAGFRIVSGGTDNHLFLIDLYSRGVTGKDAQPALDRAGITVNKNSIPFDPTPPMTAGGIRLGTPAVTTRGMREADMERIAAWIAEALSHLGDAERERRIRGEVAEFAVQFPLYNRRWEITHHHSQGVPAHLAERQRRCVLRSISGAPAISESAPTSATSSTSLHAPTVKRSTC